jgi:serine/threonine protein phosphatase PrpC
MEDAHTIVLTMAKHPDTAFFGIFDGHSGSLCSNYISERLYKDVDELQDLFDEKAVARVVMDCDQSFLDSYVTPTYCTHDVYSEEFRHNEDGAAGIFSLVQRLPDGTYKTIHANIGDSRTILARCTEGGQYEAITCTTDHKPTDPAERARIEAAGGSVTVRVMRVQY